LLEVVGLGLAANLTGLLAAAVLGYALGIEVGLVGIVALVGGAVLLSILPVSLGGWGLREAGMVALFAGVGVPAEPVLAMSLVWGLLPLLVSLPAGLLWWVNRHSPDTANR
jgi:glycosyltransferase 2 family protein